MRVAYAIFSMFGALILVGGFLASCALLNAQIATRPAPQQRHRPALPAVNGADGSQTGTASFLGNFTTITTPSGAALALGRESDCKLTLATGNYTIAESTLNYTETALIPDYGRVLHSEAQLTTTPDVFASGCAIEPTAGFGSRPGVFVGMTTSGVYVYAGIGLIYPALVEGVYLLTGTTSFSLSSFQDSSVGNLTAADLNKDGNGDLVILDSAAATTARVIVMLGNADGTFKNGVIYPIAGNYSVAAVIDDVNGDGKLDIVAVSGDQQISVLLGNGDGTFQAAQSFAAPTLPGYTSAASTPIVNLITADLRGIGKKDIICSNGLVLLGNGNGTFTAVATPAFPYFQDSLYAGGPNLSSGDLNKDGKIDLAVNNGSSISTWIGNGDGTFAQGASYASINSDGFISVSDLDGDGNADIFVGLGDGGVYAGDEGSANLSYALMGNGDGTFQGAPQLISGGYSGNNLVDLNGDGVPDLVSSTSAGSLSVQLGTGKGAFAAGVNIAPPASFSLNGYNFTMGSSAQASSFAVGDVNGDSKPDLVFVDNSLTAVASGGTTPITYPYPVYFVALGNGDGTFQTPVPYAFPQIAPGTDFDNSNTVSNLEIADVNHDGHADLISVYNEIAGGTGVNPYNQGIVVLPGNGDGTFKAPVLTSTYSSTTAPTTALVPQIDNIGDLNGDGYPDLIVNSPGTTVVNFQLQTQLQAFVGNGDGTFKTPTTIAVGADAYDTVLEDLNKDGKLDLAVLAETSSSQAELVTLLGNGDGTFGTAAVSNLTGGDSIRSANLAAADFDGNGTADLALLDPEDFSGIFYGNGDGTFTSVNTGTYLVPKDLIDIGSASLGAGTAVAADLNKDGKPDILDGGLSLINIYGETPTTTTTPTVTVTPPPSSITTAQSTMVTVAVSGGSGAATPTGSVTLSSGTYASAATTLSSGSAVITVPAGSLAAGTDTLTATYTPDSTSASIYNGSTGTGSITVTVPATPTFALSNSGNIAVSPGVTTANTSTIAVTPSGGFTGAVALTCAIAPAAANDPATCTLAPASVTIAGTTAGTSTLTLTTTAATTAALTRPKPGSSRWYAAGGASLACVLLFVVPAHRRRLRTMLGMIVLFACLAVGIVSCGGGGGGGGGSNGGGGGGGGTSNPGTTAGTYTVTVTGTAGSTTETTAVTLTVN